MGAGAAGLYYGFKLLRSAAGPLGDFIPGVPGIQEPSVRGRNAVINKIMSPSAQAIARLRLRYLVNVTALKKQGLFDDRGRVQTTFDRDLIEAWAKQAAENAVARLQ